MTSPIHQLSDNQIVLNKQFKHRSRGKIIGQLPTHTLVNPRLSIADHEGYEIDAVFVHHDGRARWFDLITDTPLS